MKLKILLASLLLAAGLAIYLLWPLKTDDFKISWDLAAIEKKRQILAAIEPARAQDSLPNILLIVADDLGVNDISFYGNGKVRTPHIDGIGRNGVAFNQAYTASPLCSPSRASMLTGRYPQRFGFEFQMHDRYLANRLEYYGFKYFINSEFWKPMPMEKVPRDQDIKRQGLPPSEITIAELLKARGYVTAITGKWHTGTSEENLPLNLGFDYQYGFCDAHTLYAPVGTAGITDQRIEKDFTDKYNWKLGRTGWHGIFRNGERTEEPEHLTDAITRESIEFIRQNKDHPFFLMAAYNAPHTPLQAPDRYVEMYNDEPDPVKRVYYAMIKQLDDNIGRLLDELANQGLLENTLIVFLSDNGGAAYTFTTENGPLRGGKITDFEGGLRVPFFMSWLGKISPETNFSYPVITMDVFATIAGAAGLNHSFVSETDGSDLLRHINNEDSVRPHPNLYWQRGNSKAIRCGDWKVVWNEEFGDTVMYDLLTDPYELYNKYADNKALAIELTGLHQEWSDRLPQPLWPAVIHFRERVDDRWFYFDD